ncbi:DUF5007 domain-containing protein [Mucilaginibacter sp. FT3.2]|uniref:DUF5007 domain-containing protein n=1 Tax=Mucilaginibacter sp. FT3.2 TaxID=2723090 RepID=UPI00161EA560|nr:DUF5007 domain-containing protein [Mucilaginibacter sp. FT3.2]MBB6229850.1 hypothetical protein [Mucilaginibacter sp. FT3.2]
MKQKYKIQAFSILFMALVLAIGTTGCLKNLPSDRESIATNTQFTQTVYTPVLGRNTLFSNNFSVGNSSQPLTFKIINMRNRDGSAAPELTENFPVQVWTQAYLGDEKSIAEIEAKRTIENHPLFEIREHSGQFLMWSAALSTFVKTQPDSGYVFDVEMSNSGGRRYFRDFKLMPLKERSFEPSTFNAITGLSQHTGLSPSDVQNIIGAKTNRGLGGDDIEVQFHKVGEGNSLKFKFVDSLYNPIDPALFNLTKWDKLVHGFDMEKTNAYVKYTVAYPVPLIAYKTQYTNAAGDNAHVTFSYDRQAYGNIRSVSNLNLDFAIYEKGDWEITFWFKTESPKFIND